MIGRQSDVVEVLGRERRGGRGAREGAGPRRRGDRGRRRAGSLPALFAAASEEPAQAPDGGPVDRQDLPEARRVDREDLVSDLGELLLQERRFALAPLRLLFGALLGGAQSLREPGGLPLLLGQAARQGGKAPVALAESDREAALGAELRAGRSPKQVDEAVRRGRSRRAGLEALDRDLGVSPGEAGEALHPVGEVAAVAAALVEGLREDGREALARDAREPDGVVGLADLLHEPRDLRVVVEGDDGDARKRPEEPRVHPHREDEVAVADRGREPPRRAPARKDGRGLRPAHPRAHPLRDGGVVLDGHGLLLEGEEERAAAGRFEEPIQSVGDRGLPPLGLDAHVPVPERDGEPRPHSREGGRDVGLRGGLRRRNEGEGRIRGDFDAFGRHSQGGELALRVFVADRDAGGGVADGLRELPAGLGQERPDADRVEHERLLVEQRERGRRRVVRQPPVRVRQDRVGGEAPVVVEEAPAPDDDEVGLPRARLRAPADRARRPPRRRASWPSPADRRRRP